MENQRQMKSFASFTDSQLSISSMDWNKHSISAKTVKRQVKYWLEVSKGTANKLMNPKVSNNVSRHRRMNREPSLLVITDRYLHLDKCHK